MAEIAAGSRVRLVGLTTRAELNGFYGSVAGSMEEGRYPVQLITPSARRACPSGIRVKPVNLMVVVDEPPSSASRGPAVGGSGGSLSPEEVRACAQSVVKGLIDAIRADLYPS